MSEIFAQNREACQLGQYEDQKQDKKNSNVRYLLQPSDSSSIYRLFTKSRGINTSRPAELNVDDWLTPGTDSVRSEVASAVHHYQGRTRAPKSRFEMVMATEEMDQAAFELCHGGQMVIDLTFGLCDRKILIVTAMGIDADGKGVPVAFMLFPAPEGNRLTPAGYDNVILAKRWEHGAMLSKLGIKDPSSPPLSLRTPTRENDWRRCKCGLAPG
jgi:hypothetical protein